MRRTTAVILSLVLVVLTNGCTKSWKLDYGQPAAQFDESTLLEKGQPYVGKKITVKGVVVRQDLSDPNNCKIYLGHGICSNFGDFKKMAESYTTGRTVFIDGFLERCEQGDILLSPAMGRDPSAPFDPIE